jgi:hypothetical protein
MIPILSRERKGDTFKPARIASGLPPYASKRPGDSDPAMPLREPLGPPLGSSPKIMSKISPPWISWKGFFVFMIAVLGKSEAKN